MTAPRGPTGGPPGSSPTRSSLRLLLVGNPGSVHVRRWARAFIRRGHDVHVAGLWNPAAGDRDEDYEVHRLGRPALSAFALRRLAGRLRPHVVHAHYLTHYGWIAWASGSRPYAVTLWGSDVLLDPTSSRVRRAWARVALAGADLVTADAPEVLARAIELGARPRAVREIQFGVDTARFRPGPKPDDLAERLGVVGRRVVLSPRALTPLYRVDVAVEALAELGPEVVLVGTLSGSDPDYVRRIGELSDVHGLRDRVRLVPEIGHDEIDALFRLADVVVSIPASDGTPVSILEAMATGVPVVATDLPSVRRWLGGVREDLLVPVGDHAATARALRTALSLSIDERDRVSRLARELVVAEADHDLEMDEVEAAYQDIARR